MKKSDLCCKCGRVCKRHKGYKKYHPNEKIVVLPTGSLDKKEIYCAECFEEWIRNYKTLKKGGELI